MTLVQHFEFISKLTVEASTPSPVGPAEENLLAMQDLDFPTLASTLLQIEEPKALFIASIFDSEFYSSSYSINSICARELFLHYLEIGIRCNYSPSAVFDLETAQRLLMQSLHVGDDPENHLSHCTKVHKESAPWKPDNDTIFSNIEDSSSSIMLWWLNEGFDSIVPNALFDEIFYQQQYPDIEESGINPYRHYAMHGSRENRAPCAYLNNHGINLHTYFPDEQWNFVQFFRSLPGNVTDEFSQQKNQDNLLRFFMPDLYRCQLQCVESVPEEALFSHFIMIGCNQGNRPSVLFHEHYYIDQISKTDVVDDSWTVDTESLPMHATESMTSGSCSPYFHWYFIGSDVGIIPTPLFDNEHYTDTHVDIRKTWNEHPFFHYLLHGAKEGFRSISVYFESKYRFRNSVGALYPYPILDYILHGQFNNLKPASGLDLSRFSNDDPYRNSPLEQAAIHYRSRKSRLHHGELARMIEKSTHLEPQLLRPYGETHIRHAPVFHPDVDLVTTIRQVKESLSKNHYESIVLIPHCRKAGSARVAGIFSQILSELTATENILIVLTDLSNFEMPDWFPNEVDVLDFSQHVEGSTTSFRSKLLLDLIRGLSPNHLININSRLGWELTSSYARQLSSWMSIYLYLFCWDIDHKGNKGGYPIQWLLPSFDYCKHVFTDSQFLSDEITSRYCLTEKQRSKVVTLHTPPESTQQNYIPALELRSYARNKRRVFWSGRMDKQKRIDILFSIAEKMPDVEFLVWGQPVLNDSKIRINDAPLNISRMGEFEDIDDLPIASCDCFLYTSEWDGIPTILIELAARGLPIVASQVGGIGELINKKTGWPVVDIENTSLYVQAISEILQDYTAALKRAENLRTHTLHNFNRKEYEKTLGIALQGTAG